MGFFENFFGNNTQTMDTSIERYGLLALPPSVGGVYDDFNYPYSPMRKFPRFPKIVNEYSLLSREQVNVEGFRTHKNLLEGLRADLTALANRVDDLEIAIANLSSVIASRVYTAVALSSTMTLSTDRTHIMSVSTETDKKSICVGLQSIYAYRVGESDSVSGAITIRDGWYYKREDLGNTYRHTFTVNVQNSYSGGTSDFRLVAIPVFFRSE